MPFEKQWLKHHPPKMLVLTSGFYPRHQQKWGMNMNKSMIFEPPKKNTSKYNNHGDQSNIKCGIETRKPWEKLQGVVKPKKIDGTSVAELICISFLLIDRLILFHILIYRTRHCGTIKAGYGKSSFKQSVNPRTQWAIYTTSQSLRNDLIVLIPQENSPMHPISSAREYQVAGLLNSFAVSKRSPGHPL